METTPTLIAVPWKPTRSASIVMTVLSTVVALVAGLIAFVVAFGTGGGTIIFDVAGLAIALGLIVVSVVAHEGCSPRAHRCSPRAFGGRPSCAGPVCWGRFQTWSQPHWAHALFLGGRLGRRASG